MPSIPSLALRRCLRTLPGLLLGTLAVLSGPALALFVGHAPIRDPGQDLVLPWLGLVLVASGSLACWSLGGLDFARRTEPLGASLDLLTGAVVAGVTLLVTCTSLALSGFPVPWPSLPAECLRSGALVALVVALSKRRPSLGPLAFWALAWFLPSLAPTATGSLLAPFGTQGPSILLLAAGLTLLASSRSPHALRHPR